MEENNNKLSLEQMLTQAAGGTVEPDPVVEEPKKEPVVEKPKEEPVVDEPKEDPVVEDPIVEDKPKPDAKKPAEKPNPMKEVRDKYNTERASREKIEAVVNKFTDGDYDLKLKDFKTEDGKVDYDALAKAMEDADIKAKADKKGIAPEVQAEIERIEKEKIELEKQKLQVSMDRALTNMQQDMNLKGVDINNFFKDAMALQKNPYRWLAQGGDLKDLYRNIYWDKLVKEQTDAAVAKARATWDEEAKRATKVPASNPAQAKPQASANATGGISMEQLLTEAAAKRK